MKSPALAPNPALVTEAMCRPLPRWAWALLLGCFLLPGWLGREAWRVHELHMLGVVDGWLSNGLRASSSVLGHDTEPYGWLYHAAVYGLTRALTGALPDLDPLWPARALALAGVGLGLWATRQTAVALALHPGAQPMKLALGGEASPQAYSQAIGNAAVLALMATLGLTHFSHEATADTWLFAAVAWWMALAARQLGPSPSRWPWGMWTTPVALAALGMAWLALAFWLLCGVIAWLSVSHSKATSRMETPSNHRLGAPHPPRRMTTLATALAPQAALLAAALVGLAWALPDASWWGTAQSNAPRAWASFANLWVWFSWPTGVMAVWSLWRWRRQARSPHVWWLALVLVLTVSAPLWRADSRVAMAALPALACLAAFAVPTLGRSTHALIDWLALLLYTVAAVFIWVIWSAMSFGWPAVTAANLSRLVPFFHTTMDASAWLAVGWGMAISGLWLLILRWRVGRHRPALWKSWVLSAAGTGLVWGLLASLWLPLLNHANGLDSVSRRIAQSMSALDQHPTCVRVSGVPPADAVGFKRSTGWPVEFVRDTSPEGPPTSCPWWVAGVTRPQMVSELPEGWTLEASHKRYRANREVWRVYRHSTREAGNTNEKVEP